MIHYGQCVIAMTRKAVKNQIDTEACSAVFLAPVDWKMAKLSQEIFLFFCFCPLLNRPVFESL
jgi:hypothetical protein